MVKKSQQFNYPPPVTRNAPARALAHPLFKQRVIRDRTKYHRKERHARRTDQTET